jgi:hypothetical protein
MSPPEVWGPAVWTLFHTLVEKINEDHYLTIYQQLVFHIQRICRFLPCPDCADDASKYLTKVNLANCKTKVELKNMMYLFHNYVNAKKRKSLFNYGNIDIYKNNNLIHVINNFLLKYNTKGNMKLLAESFQRQLIIKEITSWLNKYMYVFIPKVK